jgi:maltokinase
MPPRTTDDGRRPDGSSAGDSAAIVAVLGGDLMGGDVERQVSTDQVNLSVAVGERYLVKWMREDVDPQALDVLERLRASDFVHAPRWLGAHVVDGRVVALVHELVPGATDGWVWYVDDVLGWLDGTLALDGLVDTARRMGAITAELHDAFADDPRARGPIAPHLARIERLAAQAFALVDGEQGERLRALRPAVQVALAPLGAVGDVAVQRIHGDLHAGQFLRAGDRLLLTDFDGDPLAAPGEHWTPQPIERDVASLVQSIDHVARVAAKRRPGADVEPFIAPATDACLAGYVDRRSIDARLLTPFRVGQELHEWVYAVTRLPVWRYVPDAALARLLR